MIKIGLSGIPLAGKTSISAEVKKILSLTYRVEGVEEVSKNNPFDVSQKADFCTHFFFLTNQVNMENIKTSANPEIVICDQTILDGWIHWKKSLSSKKNDERLKKRNQLLKAIYQFWIPTYDVIFHLRANLRDIEKRKPPEDFRTLDLQELKELENLFLQIITEEKLKTIEIWNQNSIDESAQKVVQELTDLKII